MLTEDKVSHLSHVLLKQLLSEKIVETAADEGAVRKEIKRTIQTELKIGEEMDRLVKRKIESLSKKLIEGSPEWEIMYRKYFREEEIRRGRASG
jgi:hypothetical protein